MKIGFTSVDSALSFGISNHHNINGEIRKDEIEKIIKTGSVVMNVV